MTLAIAASSSSQLCPAVQTEVGQNVAVEEDIVHRFARRVDTLDRIVDLHPVKRTPGCSGREIRNTFCKTVMFSSFFTRILLLIDFP